jgi:hypothetical protein
MSEVGAVAVTGESRQGTVDFSRRELLKGALAGVASLTLSSAVHADPAAPLIAPKPEPEYTWTAEYEAVLEEWRVHFIHEIKSGIDILPEYRRLEGLLQLDIPRHIYMWCRELKPEGYEASVNWLRSAHVASLLNNPLYTKELVTKEAAIAAKTLAELDEWVTTPDPTDTFDCWLQGMQFSLTGLTPVTRKAFESKIYELEQQFHSYASFQLEDIVDDAIREMHASDESERRFFQDLLQSSDSAEIKGFRSALQANDSVYECGGDFYFDVDGASYVVELYGYRYWDDETKSNIVEPTVAGVRQLGVAEVFHSARISDLQGFVERDEFEALAENALCLTEIERSHQVLLSQYDFPDEGKIVYLRFFTEEPDRTFGPDVYNSMIRSAALKARFGDRVLVKPIVFTDTALPAVKEQVTTAYENDDEARFFLCDFSAHGLREHLCFADKPSAQELRRFAATFTDAEFNFTTRACHGGSFVEPPRGRLDVSSGEEGSVAFFSHTSADRMNLLRGELGSGGSRYDLYFCKHLLSKRSTVGAAHVYADRELKRRTSLNAQGVWRGRLLS